MDDEPIIGSQRAAPKSVAAINAESKQAAEAVSDAGDPPFAIDPEEFQRLHTESIDGWQAANPTARKHETAVEWDNDFSKATSVTPAREEMSPGAIQAEYFRKKRELRQQVERAMSVTPAPPQEPSIVATNDGFDYARGGGKQKTARELYAECMDKGVPMDWPATPAARSNLPVSLPRPDPYREFKSLRFIGGPADGSFGQYLEMPADGVICFFTDNGKGGVEQAVYRIILKEIERTDDEKKYGVPQAWEWIGDFMGKRRYIAPQVVNGIRRE